MTEQAHPYLLDVLPQALLLKEIVFLCLAEIEHLMQAIDTPRLEGYLVVHKEFGIGRILKVKEPITIHFPALKVEESQKKFEVIKKKWFWFIGGDKALFEQVERVSAKPVNVRNLETIQIVVEAIGLLRENQPEQARNVLETGRHLLMPFEYGLLSAQINDWEYGRLKNETIAALKEFRFIDADCLQERYAPFTDSAYLHKKTEQVIRAFKPVQALSDEQALAITANGDQQLVKARAGSGKTRVLTAKTRYLVEYCGIHPDHILVMAFNKKAAVEIKQRIQHALQVKGFENARTFHSLAYQLVKPDKKILFDDGNEALSHQALSEFVREVLISVWNAEICAQLTSVFRHELRSLQQTESSLNRDDYYIYRRNFRDLTLAGDHVKSVGEKFIGDFLFEHAISYRYEPVEFWSGGSYRPDFSVSAPLHSQIFFIEHWGIDPNDLQSRPPDWWSRSRKEYCISIRDKRKYCASKDIALIETSVADLRRGREEFEALLKGKLETLGIECQKLPQDELERLVIHKQKNRLIGLFVQFIQKAKKQNLSPDDVQARKRAHMPVDERERIFLNVACQVYETYQEKLQMDEQIDFDDLLSDAARLIRQTSGECVLNLGLQKNRRIAVKELRWLLLDEYQDLSHSFFDLIQAIQEVNPAVQLMCVGDDWQAINGFAGSDLKYMNEFSQLYPGAETHHLLTNYRNERSIIESGNRLMTGLGKPGRHLPGKSNGEVNVLKVDELYIESRKDDAYAEQCRIDDKFKFFRQTKRGPKINDNGFLQAKYLKACYEIITDHENLNQIAKLREKEDKLGVAILSRTRRLCRIQLDEFGRKLNSIFTDEQKRMIGNLTSKIRIGTVHSFKGLEAEIVIVLRVAQGAFPLIHPDNALFRLFGETEASVLAEERRLFYVALTRAASKTYLLTESGQESDYLEELEGQNLITTISL